MTPRIGLAGCQAGLEALPLGEAFDVLERAERVGLDGVWVNEEHLGGRMKGRVCWATLPFLAHVAGRIPRIRLGSAALLLPLHHPLRLAEEIGSLCEFAPGRVCMGIAPSRPGPYADAFGLTDADHRGLFESTLDAVCALLEGKSVDLPGAQAVTSMVVPKTAPQFYRAAYSPQSLATAAYDRMPLVQHYIQSPESVQRGREIYREAGGREDLLRRSPVHRFVALAHTEEEANALANRLAEKLTARLRGFGIDKRGDVTTAADLEPERFATHTAVAGTPETIVDRLTELADGAGTDTVNINLGWMGTATAREVRTSAELFIETLKSSETLKGVNYVH